MRVEDGASEGKSTNCVSSDDTGGDGIRVEDGGNVGESTSCDMSGATGGGMGANDGVTDAELTIFSVVVTVGNGEPCRLGSGYGTTLTVNTVPSTRSLQVLYTGPTLAQYAYGNKPS
jgi:hypothetical protein